MKETKTKLGRFSEVDEENSFQSELAELSLLPASVQELGSLAFDRQPGSHIFFARGLEVVQAHSCRMQDCGLLHMQ